MKIQLRMAKMALTAAQRSRIELQLGLALGRFGDQIGRVVGHLRNAGQRRAPDRRCRIEVDMRPRRISVEEADADLQIAVRRAAARASRQVAQALQEERLQERDPLWPSGPSKKGRGKRQ